MVIPLRVGDSFVADVNRFAQAVVFAIDNDAVVIQEALGTLNISALARDAVEYAYDHGATVMASAADEAAQHHNWPSSYAARDRRELGREVRLERSPRRRQSYVELQRLHELLEARSRVAIPSSSCSSNAVGLAAGMAGLIYSAALNARHAGTLDPAPSSTCHAPDGNECLITPNEVRQLIASGKVGGHAHANAADSLTEQADDVNFISGAAALVPCRRRLHRPEPLLPAPRAGTAVRAGDHRAERTRSYPARKGLDQYYGYGRVNMVKAVERTTARRCRPRPRSTAPELVRADRPCASQPRRARLRVRARPRPTRASFRGRARLGPQRPPPPTPTSRPVPSSNCVRQHDPARERATGCSRRSTSPT